MIGEDNSGESPEKSAVSILWESKTGLAVILPLILTMIIGLPGAGVLAPLTVVVFLALLNIKRMSFRGLGFGGRSSMTATILPGPIMVTAATLIPPLSETRTGDDGNSRSIHEAH